jgi:hypothetical protein
VKKRGQYLPSRLDKKSKIHTNTEEFKEARLIATEDFCNRREYSKDGKYIPFPSTQEIQALADQIKNFVEEK